MGDVAVTITRALELPRIVHLGPNLYGAAFSLMKLLPARHILDRARDDGLLEPGTVVIESTSGTFGLALAMECRLRGRPLILVSDPAVDPALRRRMRDLGAAVDIVAEPADVGGYQRARLDRLAELCSRHPRHFLPAQYSNPDNPGAYALLADGYMDACGVQNLFLEVDMAFQAFQDLWAGKKPEKLLLDPGFVITQANKDQTRDQMWGYIVWTKNGNKP